MTLQKSEMLNLLNKIAAFYDRFGVSGEKVDAWYSIFKNYNYNDLEYAIEKFCQNSAKMPTVADIKNTYFDIKEKKQAKQQEQFRQDAKNGDICRFCNNNGYFYVEEFHDGVIYEAVAPCKCLGNPTALNYYLQDKSRKWDDSRKIFALKTKWVGDEDNQCNVVQPALNFSACVKTL